jgi:DNA-binding winged helix-turn-helix (wHTH) protein/TolB-like protein
VSIIQFEQFSFCSERGSLRSPHGEASLRPKTAKLLEYLLLNKGRVICKDELFTHLWPDSVVTEHTLSQSIKDVRQALGDDAKNPRFLRTLPKRGFQWLVESTLTSENIDTPVNIENADFIAAKLDGTVKQLKQFLNNKQLLLVAAVLLLVLLGIILNNFNESSQDSAELQDQPLLSKAGETNIDATQSSEVASATMLTVLPIINATKEPKLNWVQLGLWDMIIAELDQYQSISVTSKRKVQQMVTEEVAALSLSQLEQLNAKFGSNIIMQLTLERENNGFRLVYQWSNSRQPKTNGQGYYLYENTPAEINGLITKIISVVQPQMPVKPTTYFSENNEANQDMARGLQSLYSDNVDLAKRYFEAALIRDANMIWANYYLAEAEYLLGNWQHSDELYRQLMDASLQDYGVKRIQIRAKVGLAKIEIGRGNMTLANELLQSARQTAESAEDSEAQIEALWQLADLSVKRGLWQLQQQYLDQAEQLSRTTENLSLLYQSLFNLGQLDSPGRDEEKRLQDLQQALLYFKRWQDKRGEAGALLALGTKQQLPIQTRLQYQLSALEKYQQSRDKVGEAWAMMSIGWLYLQQFDPDSAEKYLNSALVLHQNMGANTNQAFDVFYLGFAALDKGSRRNGQYNKQQLEQAREFLTQSLTLFRETSMPERLPIAHLLLASIDIDQENFVAAEMRLPQIVSDALPGQQPGMRAFEQLMKAFIKIRQQQWQQALALLLPLRQLMADHPLVLHYLARCHYELGDISRAIEMTELLKSKIAAKWQDKDQQRLQLFRTALVSLEPIEMAEESNPYLLMIAYVF